MRTLRILVVDDEAGTRNLLARMFRYRGYEVRLAECAQAALDLLREGPPYDAVVADLIMPGGDGERMVREMRSVDPDLPVVVVSGKMLSPQELERLESLGARYHPKPYRNHDILETLEQVTRCRDATKAGA